jgi:hypothetical protein
MKFASFTERHNMTQTQATLRNAAQKSSEERSKVSLNPIKEINPCHAACVTYILYSIYQKNRLNFPTFILQHVPHRAVARL